MALRLWLIWLLSSKRNNCCQDISRLGRLESPLQVGGGWWQSCFQLHLRKRTHIHKAERFKHQAVVYLVKLGETTPFYYYTANVDQGSSDLELHEKDYHLIAKTFAVVERQFGLHKPLQMILPALTVPLNMTGHLP